jgi:pimeloyl-ACP methyl ester carboxylesterase
VVVHKLHNPNTSTDWCAVVAHGGGQIHYGNIHPLVKFLLLRVRTVYSFDIPQHGSYSRTLLENPVRDAVQQVHDTISPIIQNKKIIFVAFSVGGLLLMKQWARITSICLDYIGIFIGIGLRGDIELCKKWTSFWDAETIIAQKRDRMMLNLMAKRGVTLHDLYNLFQQVIQRWNYIVRNKNESL